MARIWGSDPGKQGGKDYRADREIKEDKGPLTCGSCNGRGVQVREIKKVDDDGDAYTEQQEKTCGTCKGKGAVG